MGEGSRGGWRPAAVFWRGRGCTQQNKYDTQPSKQAQFTWRLIPWEQLKQTEICSKQTLFMPVFYAWLIKHKSGLGRADTFQQSAPQNCPWNIPTWWRCPKARYIRKHVHPKFSVLHWQHNWFLVKNLSLKSSLEKAEKAGRHGLNSTSDVSLPCFFPSGCFNYFMTLMEGEKTLEGWESKILFSKICFLPIHSLTYQEFPVHMCRDRWVFFFLQEEILNVLILSTYIHKI